LEGSIEDISKASDETSKIIKTIDEIAFQTNLLALNAAEEMSAQAAHMKKLVQDLIEIVGERNQNGVSSFLNNLGVTKGIKHLKLPLCSKRLEKNNVRLPTV
jgi:methyl-accepting chemotaxis protein-like sensor